MQKLTVFKIKLFTACEVRNTVVVLVPDSNCRGETQGKTVQQSQGGRQRERHKLRETA